MSNTHTLSNIYIFKGYNNALSCTEKIHGYNTHKKTCFMFCISPWNLTFFNRHYLIVLRTVMKQSDIYITPFTLNNPKGLYKTWKNDFAHVQYATTEGWKWGGRVKKWTGLW